MPTQPRAPKAQPTLANTNRWSTRSLVAMALMCAVGVLLSFVEFPLLPGVTWLKYDASAVPALMSGLAFGPAGGVTVGLVGAAIHGILFADFSGAVMNMLVVTAFVWPSAWLWRRAKGAAGRVVALVIGCVCMVAFAVLGNLVITPAWLGVPLDAVVAMIVPVLVPFNALKAALNAVLGAAVYRAVRPLLAPLVDDGAEGSRAHG